MRAFEIHTYQGGKWSIDSIFDDRELALHEAQRMDQSGRYVGVRVVEEVYDEATDRTSTKTIFRGTRTDEVNAQHLERSIDTRREVQADRRKRQAQRAQASRARPHAAKKKQPNLVYFLVMIALIGAFGLGTLIGLNFLQNMH